MSRKLLLLLTVLGLTAGSVAAQEVRASISGVITDSSGAPIPGAQITFKPDRELQPILDRLLLPPDDRNAQMEWGWEAAYTQGDVIDDFLRELRDHPGRYA